jgi:5'-nucleotidase
MLLSLRLLPASHKITFYEPLIFNHINIEGMFQGYSVQGTPADCVKLAVMQISKEPFDLLVAGINDGPMPV